MVSARDNLSHIVLYSAQLDAAVCVCVCVCVASRPHLIVPEQLVSLMRCYADAAVSATVARAMLVVTYARRPHQSWLLAQLQTLNQRLSTDDSYPRWSVLALKKVKAAHTRLPSVYV